MKSELHVGGQFRFVHKRGNEILSDSGWVNNTVTNASFAVLSGLAGNVDSQTAFTYIAVGTSNTAPAASQTALGTELATAGLTRASATVSRTTTTQTNDTLQLYKEFTVSGAGATVEEAGIFNASSSGTMLARALTGTKALSSGDKFQVTYAVKFS